MATRGIRKPEKALAARFVDTVSKQGKYFDGHGLYLRVQPNGSKQWVQRITIRGKRCELGLGSPPAISLATARKLALENRGKAMLGGDPLQERRDARAVITFDEAVEKYLASKLAEFRNQKHRDQWRSTLRTYASPVIGAKQVSHITVQDVLKVVQPLWLTKTETASRVRGRIEAVLSWATVAGQRSGDNPARWKGNLSELLPKPNKVAKKKNHPSVALTDATRWWTELREREGIAARALEFLTLTGARSGEVREMIWDEVKIEADPEAEASTIIWTIPAERMKAKRTHRVPLPAAAVEILQSMPRDETSPYVFPGAKQGRPLSDMSISAVMRRMHEDDIAAGGPGYLDPINRRPAVPHGLRSTFRQWAAEQGYPREMAEIALAHIVGTEVERAYQRSDMLELRRDMMKEWAGFLISGGTGVRKPVLGGIMAGAE